MVGRLSSIVPDVSVSAWLNVTSVGQSEVGYAAQRSRHAASHNSAARWRPWWSRLRAFVSVSLHHSANVARGSTSRKAPRSNSRTDTQRYAVARIRLSSNRWRGTRGTTRGFRTYASFQLTRTCAHIGMGYATRGSGGCESAMAPNTNVDVSVVAAPAANHRAFTIPRRGRWAARRTPRRGGRCAPPRRSARRSLHSSGTSYRHA